MAYGNNNYYGANNYATPFTPYTQNQSYAQPNYYNNAMGMNNNSYVQQPIMNNGINQNQQQSNQQNNSIDLRDYVKRDELKELKDKINDLNNALMSFNKPLNKENTNNTSREKRG